MAVDVVDFSLIRSKSGEIKIKKKKKSRNRDCCSHAGREHGSSGSPAFHLIDLQKLGM